MTSGAFDEFENMTLAQYVALSQPAEEIHNPGNLSLTGTIEGTIGGTIGGTLTRGYADGTCDEVSIFEEKYPQGDAVNSFDYTLGAYEYLSRYIRTNLESIECVKVKYDADLGRLLCVYGTAPLWKQLSASQLFVYRRKNELLWHCDYSLTPSSLQINNKISFYTVWLTNILGRPFNCFLKAGITNSMRRNLNLDIEAKAKEKFPYKYIGKTPWEDMIIEDAYDEEFLPPIIPFRWWSNNEIVLRKNKNKINIYFNRIQGDHSSADFILETLSLALSKLTPRDIAWSGRSSYLQLEEGCHVKKDNHITKYLLNHWIGREICSFVC